MVYYTTGRREHREKRQGERRERKSRERRGKKERKKGNGAEADQKAEDCKKVPGLMGLETQEQVN